MGCCSETSAEVVKDPICGMEIDPAKAAGLSQYQGQTYSFCSVGCKKKFDLNPAQYIQSDTWSPLLQPQSVAVPPAAGAIKAAASGKYTCPMHPGGTSG
jgi:Cu+-exporting ATPase